MVRIIFILSAASLVIFGALSIVGYYIYKINKQTMGTYKTAGQKMFFLFNKTEEEILESLQAKEKNTVMPYHIYQKNNKYYMIIKQNNSINLLGNIPVTYSLDFEYDDGNATYVVIRLLDKKQILLTSVYEPQIYQLMIRIFQSVPITNRRQ